MGLIFCRPSTMEKSEDPQVDKNGFSHRHPLSLLGLNCMVYSIPSARRTGLKLCDIRAAGRARPGWRGAPRSDNPVAGETVLGMTAVQLGHLRIASHLGQNGGGADGSHQAVALTTARASIGKLGQRLPSMKTSSGAMESPATARCIASMVACRMLSSSISVGLARPTDQASAFCLISSNRARRFFSESFGVVQPDDGIGRVKNHRGGDHVTHQRATAHLVHTGNQPVVRNIDHHLVALNQNSPAGPGVTLAQPCGRPEVICRAARPPLRPPADPRCSG